MCLQSGPIQISALLDADQIRNLIRKQRASALPWNDAWRERRLHVDEFLKRHRVDARFGVRGQPGDRERATERQALLIPRGRRCRTLRQFAEARVVGTPDRVVTLRTL